MIPIIMDRFKCPTVFYCDVLNKKDTIISVDFFEACVRNLQDLNLFQKIGVILQLFVGEKRFSKVGVADLSLI